MKTIEKREMTSEEEQINKNLLMALYKLRAALGANGVILGDNEVAALICLIEGHLHMNTELDPHENS